MAIDEINAQMADKQNAITAIEQNPANQMPPGNFWRYTPKARKKLDALRVDIAYLMGKKREIEGNPVDQAGYSGRQSNRR